MFINDNPFRRHKKTEPMNAVEIAEIAELAELEFVTGGCAACGNPNHQPGQAPQAQSQMPAAWRR
jgi:hypothetical protein